MGADEGVRKVGISAGEEEYPPEEKIGYECVCADFFARRDGHDGGWDRVRYPSILSRLVEKYKSREGRNLVDSLGTPYFEGDTISTNPIPCVSHGDDNPLGCSTTL